MKTKMTEELDHIRLELRQLEYDLYLIQRGEAPVAEIPIIRNCLDNIFSFMEETDDLDPEPETWSQDSTIRRFAHGSNALRARLGLPLADDENRVQIGYNPGPSKKPQEPELPPP